MSEMSRRAALAIGLVGASAVATMTSNAVDAADGETTIAKGVVVRKLGEGPAMIPGYRKVVLRDVVLEPGASSPPNNAMKNPMVCHITEGELRVVQDGKSFMAAKNHVWTCDTGTVEQVFNQGNVQAIMRITDLMA
jgi:hypothetical protein